MWKILNEPFTLSIIVLLWGSLVSNYIASKWNRYNKTIELRYTNFERLYSQYHRYIRIIKADPIDLASYSEIHSEFVAQTKLAAALFENTEIYEYWRQTHQRLANIVDKRIKDCSYNYENEIGFVFENSSKVLPLMIKEMR